MPPEHSLPAVIAPCPSWQETRRMMTFYVGTAILLPSLLRPDLSAMQSSPVEKPQSRMSTSRHDSGSHPSLFGPGELTVTPLTVTFVQSTGWITYIGD